MIAQLKNWFAALSPREQWMLGIAGVLAALVVTVYGLLLPGMAAIEAAEKDLDAAIERRGRIEARVETARKAPADATNDATPLAAGQTLESLVKDSALAAGLELSEGAASGPDQFTFRMASVKAGALLAWLSSLAGYGVEIKEIRLLKGDAGFVAADVILSRPRR